MGITIAEKNFKNLKELGIPNFFWRKKYSKVLFIICIEGAFEGVWKDFSQNFRFLKILKGFKIAGHRPFGEFLGRYTKNTK